MTIVIAIGKYKGFYYKKKKVSYWLSLGWVSFIRYTIDAETTLDEILWDASRKEDPVVRLVNRARASKSIYY